MESLGVAQRKDRDMLHLLSEETVQDLVVIGHRPQGRVVVEDQRSRYRIFPYACIAADHIEESTGH